MTLAPVINTDVKMPRRMLTALNRYEAICVVSSIEKVAEADVRRFLTDEYGAEFAATFKPEFLFSSPAP